MHFVIVLDNGSLLLVDRYVATFTSLSAANDALRNTRYASHVEARTNALPAGYGTGRDVGGIASTHTIAMSSLLHRFDSALAGKE